MCNTILEIAERSGFYIPQEPLFKHDRESLDRINEFARLLLSECRIVVAENFHECKTAVKLDNQIKQHFGIQ